jgi:hypothetical protein
MPYEPLAKLFLYRARSFHQRKELGVEELVGQSQAGLAGAAV